jgi:hypothetical protein
MEQRMRLFKKRQQDLPPSGWDADLPWETRLVLASDEIERAFAAQGKTTDRGDANVAKAKRTVQQSGIPNAQHTEWSDVRVTGVPILAAILGCTPCAHYHWQRAEGGTAMLALRRVMCERDDCFLAATPLVVTSADDDRCDWCGRHGVSGFTPVETHLGPTRVVGDSCLDCLSLLKGGVTGTTDTAST